MATRPTPNDPFTSRPAPEQMKTKYKLVRCPGKGLPPLLVLSHDVVGANTHYVSNRTRPCAGETCTYCSDEQLPRWRGYLAVATPDLSKIAFIEVTPAVMGKIDEYFRKNRTLRGAKITLARKNGKDNGELWAELSPPPANQAALPKAPSQRTFLAAIWQMKETAAANKKTPAPKIYPPQVGPDFGDTKTA